MEEAFNVPLKIKLARVLVPAFKVPLVLIFVPIVVLTPAAEATIKIVAKITAEANEKNRREYVNSKTLPLKEFGTKLLSFLSIDFYEQKEVFSPIFIPIHSQM